MEIREIRAGQGSKGTLIMRQCVQWRQLHDDRVLQEPREVFPLCGFHKRRNMKYLNLWALLIVITASFVMMIANAQPAKVKVIEEINIDAQSATTVSEPLPQTVFSDDVLKEIECLAKNIYKEAGYEPLEGRIAVAQVTMNRVEHREFPNTVCGVVYEKTRNRNTGKMTTCQFSWYCDPVHRNRPVHQPTYNESYEIAKQVLLDDVRLPGLENAVFYHAVYINPRWNYSRVARIGQHIFYEPRSRITLAKHGS